MRKLGYVPDAAHQVVIEHVPPAGILIPDYPAAVNHDEEWEGRVLVRNVGGEAGWFRLVVTPIPDPQQPGIEDGSLLFILAGEEAETTHKFVKGPRTFEARLYTLEWVEDAVYNFTVSPRGAGAKVTSPQRKVLSSVTVEMSAGPAEGSPLGCWMNPNLPTEADPDEPWSGTIDACNCGDFPGWLGCVEADHFFFAQPGFCNEYIIGGTGPGDFVIHLSGTKLSLCDSLAVVVPQRTSPPGELRNLIFPKFGVAINETWDGSVEAWNVGTTTEIFRVSMTGDIPALSDEFQLAPGESTVIAFSHLGPAGFTAIIQRKNGTWTDDHSVSEVVGRQIEGYYGLFCLANQPLAQGLDVWPGAVAWLDWEPKIPATLAMEYSPVLVAENRTYRFNALACGYPHVNVPPGLWYWDEARREIRSQAYLRNYFP